MKVYHYYHHVSGGRMLFTRSVRPTSLEKKDLIGFEGLVIGGRRDHPDTEHKRWTVVSVLPEDIGPTIAVFVKPLSTQVHRI